MSAGDNDVHRTTVPLAGTKRKRAGTPPSVVSVDGDTYYESDTFRGDKLVAQATLSSSEDGIYTAEQAREHGNLPPSMTDTFKASTIDASAARRPAWTRRAEPKAWGGERTERLATRWGNFDMHAGYEVGGDRSGLADSEVWTDHRLDIIEPSWMVATNVLDIGCGAGYFLIALMEKFPTVSSALGIDIDSSLIRKARRLCEMRRKGVAVGQTCDGVSAVPLSLRLVQGYVPSGGILRASEDASYVHFRHEDFVGRDDIGHPPGFYDVITCLNVTKWVHLNYGDKGLCVLLRKAHHLLKPGGKLLLQMQPWSGYAHSANLTSDLKEGLKRLDFRPSDIPRYLLERVGFSKLVAVKDIPSDRDTAKKQIFIFQK